MTRVVARPESELVRSTPIVETDRASDSSEPRSHAHLISAIDSSRMKRGNRAWDDAPIGLKVNLLILISLIGGLVIGMLEAISEFSRLPMITGSLMLLIVLFGLARVYIKRPILMLVRSLERQALLENPARGLELPLTRRDELGRLARVMHRVHVSAARDWQEARRLRRDLDHRVRKATQQATRQLEKMAMRDPLTEVGNRRFLEQTLPSLVESALASNTDLICLLMDLDNFKQVNDIFGHAAGDELLIFTTSLLTAGVRHEDYVVRLGGDEFVVLMPGAGVERAIELARQLITLFRQHTATAHAGKTKANLSVGVASLKWDRLKDGRQLLDLADQRLYEAKNSGKGRIVGPKAD
ncbi:MAG: diguanylate cyclase [Phycisphaeraceae bacterium]|nr:diguanylate cyclase [Phycisphaeraceae bacterium]